MIALPGMLLDPAQKAGMKIPKDEDIDSYNPEEYPHFHVYCLVQLGASMPYPTAHWDNAKIIAAIPEDKIKTITWAEIKNMIAVGDSSLNF